MKIAILLSGGVDSSVALKLLQAEGHDLTAFYLKIWLEDELSYLGDCPWEEDLAYARQICEEAAVPLEIISMQKEYWDEVVSYTITEVKEGRTPNPDILCNQRVKFGAFYNHINDSFDKIATGHYAQTKEKDGQTYLKKAADSFKDQTYFLSHLSQEQLSKALFPIGSLQKSKVRELAQKYNLPNQKRKDSQGICFLGKIKFSEFLKHHLGEKTGDIIEYETQEKLGEHLGFWYHTIGQRQGLGLSGGPWYVVKKDIPHNKVYVSREYHTPEKNRNEFEVGKLNWITKAPTNPEKNINLQVKLRHGETFHEGEVSFIKNDTVLVKIKESDQGIAPGQFAVFYEKDICLGGGTILREID
ncbi:tRNA 2-thiouridine(34) synthase MnmA [Candidatus Peregrinibacteria bacterium]|jgi:tRNA-5-taurinomethyluridine 2-sulfurtransferase|nr:tRNA 2-thiouridine(34) synthase MnmA [Candidatus Peregrinibacteria bacterium]MBT7483552.1 tRNA 2-thiouridine(34) synthase MnmA [Candidatus Peregrinibacteria bacterium]MBT7702998.1 tRNA 2-thiouridine(34) synthase MnmA [Candidatus Peregrinibacteria bacterium]